MAEVVRGGIDSIDLGQTEAAKAIGMTHVQTMLNVILPQAIRNILPATGNEFVINIKDTSVLNVISVTELFFMTKSVRGAIVRTYEAYLITAVIYLILTLTVTRILRVIERRMDGPDHFTVHGSQSDSRAAIKSLSINKARRTARRFFRPARSRSTGVARATSSEERRGRAEKAAAVWRGLFMDRL